MLGKTREIEDRYEELEQYLSQPEVIKDHRLYQKYSKEHKQLTPIITASREYRSVQEEIQSNRTLLNDPDPEIRKLAKEEIDALRSRLEQLEKELKVLLLPQDPNDEKNILLEIRAGTGGEEAAPVSYTHLTLPTN